jgi:hypothetical protein
VEVVNRDREVVGGVEQCRVCVVAFGEFLWINCRSLDNCEQLRWLERREEQSYPCSSFNATQRSRRRGAEKCSQST